MIRDVLGSIDGVGIFPVIGLVLFFGLFLVVIYRTIRMDRQAVLDAERLPLEDSLPGEYNTEQDND